jgi:2-C-methyl-D-erythritol 2,4-cyclodiphosphate synthase
LLRQAADAVRRAGWRIGSIDATVVAQAPRIAPFVDAMAANIASDLGIEPAAVNVKGKTTERLRFQGRQEGIAAQAAAMLIHD